MIDKEKTVRLFYRKKLISCVLIFMLITSFFVTTASAAIITDYTIKAYAETQISPPQITLNWVLPSLSETSATGFVIYRKSKTATSWGSSIATLSGTTVKYIDSNVSVGETYEYMIRKAFLNGTSTAYAYSYIFAGISAPMIENRGKLVLIVDKTYTTQLANELERLQEDLTGDGWTVLRHDVERTSTPQQVKAIIVADYTEDPNNVNTVFLFGHIPLAMSGSIAPDGHETRAFAADVYYGDMNGNWTDTNLDGIFDQNTIPSAIELQVGRVDMYNMPAFAPLTELDLLRRYLDKNHNYRNGFMPAKRAGFIQDEFGLGSSEAFGSSSYNNFPQLFNGADSVVEGIWKTTLNNYPYTWSGAFSGGSGGTSIVGIVNTSDFAANTYKSIFSMLFGSYVLEWTKTDNIMRAFIAQKDYGLATFWAGRPNWFVHHMGLGETIGFSTRLTQNNSGTYQALGYYYRYVHIALMGDPSLRMYPVKPPSNLDVSVMEDGTRKIKWNISSDKVLGYYIYKASSRFGIYQRITQDMINANYYIDTMPVEENTTYMVRAVKLEETGSGEFCNLSQGIMVSAIPASNEPIDPEIPIVTLKPDGKVGITATTSNGSSNRAFIMINDPDGNIDYVKQVQSEADGKYEIIYKPHTVIKGLYKVSVRDSGQGIPKNAFFRLLQSDKIDISNIAYTDVQGKFISTLKPDIDIHCSATALNNTSDNSLDNVTIILALYDGQGILKKISYRAYSIMQGETKEINAGFKLPNENLSGYQLKTFVWENPTKLRNLRKVDAFTVNQE